LVQVKKDAVFCYESDQFAVSAMAHRARQINRGKPGSDGGDEKEQPKQGKAVDSIVT
jgi:hypothetical protein